MLNNAAQSEYMIPGRGELKKVLPRSLVQDIPDEASFEMRSINSAQHLSPELSWKKKTVWSEKNGQEGLG